MIAAQEQFLLEMRLERGDLLSFLKSTLTLYLKLAGG